MSNKKKLVPRRRFKEFQNADAWEQRKLRDITFRVVRKNKDLESILPLTISAVHGLVHQEMYFNKRIASRDVSNYYLLKRGEFAYNKSYSEGFPFGAVKRLDRYDLGVLSTLYIVFALFDELVNSNYLMYYFDTTKWHKQVAERAAEGARNHGLLNISADDFFDIYIDLPVELNEQVEIGNLFNKLENLITLHQRKLDRFKELKSAYLSEMFPAEGERKPKRRFLGFTDDWEQRKLEELGTILTGSTPSSKNKYYYSDRGIPWVTPTDIASNVTFDTEKKLTPEGQKVARIVPKNTILITCIASIGKNTMLGVTGSFNQQINGLIPFSGVAHPYFLLTESILWSSEMKHIAASATMQIVNKKEFSLLYAHIPGINEQEKIGEFFLRIDNLITLHQRKLEKMKNLKKAYLNEMFPEMERE